MSSRSFREHTQLLGPTTERQKLGLGEYFQAGTGMTILNHLEYSDVFWDDYNEERRKAVYDGLEQGHWTEDDLLMFVGASAGSPGEMDYNRFAHWARGKGHHGLLTDQEIKEKMAEQEQILLGPAMEAEESAEGWESMMYMAGSVAGYALSPITWASMMLPVSGAARGVSVLGRAAVAGGKVAASEAMLELIRQPMIANWRAELGRDYSIQEGLAEVALAATGTGVLGSAAELARSLRRFRLKNKLLKGDIEEMSLRELESLETLLDNHLFPEQKALDHIQKIKDELERLNKPKVQPAGEAHAPPSKAKPPKGSKPPKGGPQAPKGPKIPPRSIVQQEVQRIDAQIKAVREGMEPSEAASQYIRELEAEKKALLSHGGSEKVIAKKAAEIEKKAKANERIHWETRIARVDAQIAKVKKDLPAGPDRQMYLDELELEKTKLEVQRKAQRVADQQMEMERMAARQAEAEGALADVPDDLADVEIFRQAIDGTGHMVEKASTLREAVEEIQDEATKATKTWECLNAA